MLKAVKKQLNRAKAATSVAQTFTKGMHKAYQLGAFKQPPRDKLPKYIQIFCQKMCLAFDVEVKKINEVPDTQGLWVSNHISWMDIPVVGSVSAVFFLSKAEISKWPLMGDLAKAAGTLFIHRGSGDAGSVSDQIADFLQQGSSVVFFPEATTTSGHKIKKLHGKLLQASIKTGLPIQPMVICYATEAGEICDAAAYYGDMTVMDSFKNILDSKKIIAHVLALETIYPEDRSQDELTEILRQRMQAGLTRLQKQVLTVKPKDAIWD